MKRTPVSRSSWSQVVTGVILVMALIGGINWLQQSMPQVAKATQLGLTDDTPEQEFVSCERTLPEADDLDGDAETVEGPVGRVSANEVNLCPRRFDGRLVTYLGEVVGDVLQRSGGAWVQINDDAYGLVSGPLPSHRDFSGTNSGLAVWLPAEIVEDVHTPGRRGVRGDIVRIVGVLHRADPQDGGGLTIRAREIRLLSPAVSVPQPVHRDQAIAAAAVSLLAIGLIIYGRRVSSLR